MEPKFYVYIDEAGDPGVKQKSTAQADWSDWFAVSAVVVSAERDGDVVDWVSDMTEAVRSRHTKALHYRNLSLSNRGRVCRMLSNKRVRLFTVASHKSSMRDHKNAILGKASSHNFYNWCLRLLLERVSTWCAHRCESEGDEIRPAKLIFSERGGHDYAELKDYIRKLDFQSRAGTLKLNARRLVPGTISPDLFEVRNHDTIAGLQLADIVASAFFQAINSSLPTHSLEPALALKKRVAKEGRNSTSAGCGLMMLPFRHQGTIPIADRAVFESYGYRFD